MPPSFNYTNDGYSEANTGFRLNLHQAVMINNRNLTDFDAVQLTAEEQTWPSCWVRLCHDPSSELPA